MSAKEAKLMRLLVITIAAVLAIFTANALIDLGGVIHDLTHPH